MGTDMPLALLILAVHGTLLVLIGIFYVLPVVAYCAVRDRLRRLKARGM